MHTNPVPIPPPHELSFLPLLATLLGGVAAVTLILCGLTGAPPAFGVVFGSIAMVLFVGGVLFGMSRLHAENGDADE